MNIVIIGSGAASKSAIDTILSADRIDIDITVITRDTNYFYSRVLLPNYIAGEISMEDLSFVDKSFIESKRLKIVRGTVISLDTQLKRVFVDKFGSIKYDKLIITSGASAIKLKNVKVGLGGIFDLRDFEDAVAIKDKAEQSSNCILIGGGLVALKTAAAIKKLDKDVTILVESERVLSRVMDKHSSELVKQLFEENGIKIVLNAKIDNIDENAGNISGIKLMDGQYFYADFVVVGKGVTPNISITCDTDIKVDKGILVNDQMKTSVDSVYAAGDVAQSSSLLSDDSMTFTLWTDAMYQGRVAANSILGIDRKYIGGLSMNSVVFYGVPFISVGQILDNEISECEVNIRNDTIKKIYRKVVLKEGHVVGFVFIGDISYAGMVSWDIKSKIEVKDPIMYLTKKGLEDLYIIKNNRLT